MIHEEKDYDIGKIPEDEPVFLLRGKDPTACAVVQYWVELNKLNMRVTKSLDVLDHAIKMRDYATTHGKPKE